MTPSSRLRLRVSPGARRSEVVGRHGDAWKLRVAAAPERGRANDEVERLLAEQLGLPRTGVEIVAGHTGQDKVVQLSGIAADQAELLLERATGKDTR